MPEGNTESYKEMYEMGERLMQMAKDGGYSPDAPEDSSEEYSQESGGEQGKIDAALKMFSNG